MKPSEFNHIILPMRDELLGYALSVTKSEDNAEDLVQEVMCAFGTCVQGSIREDGSSRLP